MEFALNYSPQAADALHAGVLHLDRFKCPPWDDLATTAEALLPIYIHFPLRTGALAEVDWGSIERWLARTGTPNINVHLYLTAKDLPGAETQPPAVVAERVEAQLTADLALLASRFGAERVIGENIPFGRRSDEKAALRACAEPEVITRVLQASGCGLLLDVAHATIAAASMGLTPLRYIGALPLERTREVHVTGVRPNDEGVLHDHLAFTEDDFTTTGAALRLLFQRGGQPWATACEYGGIGPNFDWRSEYDVIVGDAARLRAILAEA